MSNVSGEAADIEAQEKVVTKKKAAYDAADKALQDKRAEMAKFEEDVLVPHRHEDREAEGGPLAPDQGSQAPPKKGGPEKSSSKDDAAAEAAVGANGEIHSLTSDLATARKDLQAQEAVLNGMRQRRRRTGTLSSACACPTVGP